MSFLPQNLPVGLSPDEIRHATRLLSCPPYKFVDSDLFKSKDAAKRLFKDEIDMSQAELIWYDIMVQDPVERRNSSLDDKWLLTHDEEKKLFLQFNYAKLVVRKLQDISAKRKLSIQQIRRLLLWDGILQARKTTITAANLGLVISTAKKLGLLNHPNLSEFLSEGNICLVRCIELFNVKYEWKFSTYAVTGIKKAYFRVQEIWQRKTREVSNTTSEGELYQDPRDKQQEVALAQKLEQEDIRYVLNNNIAELTEQEKFILIHRFGLDGGEGLTLDAIGQKVGVSKERIRQVQNIALDKLYDVMIDRQSEFWLAK